jgi:Predicted phosphatases
MIKMVAFDFDGTIADTVPMCIEVFKKAILPYAGYELTENQIVQTFGCNEIGTIKVLAKDNWEPALRDFYFYYEKMHDNYREPFPMIRELLGYLKEKNIRVPLITGKGQISCDISLKKLELEYCFDDVMTGDEAKHNKAESILTLLEKYAVGKEEFYYIGDAPSDAAACRKAGVTCLSAAWSGGADIESLKTVNPDFIFYNISDLMDFLKPLVERS